jgi:hypothetical protein
MKAGDLALLDRHVAVPHGEELAVVDLLELAIDDDVPVARCRVPVHDGRFSDQSGSSRTPVVD